MSASTAEQKFPVKKNFSIDAILADVARRACSSKAAADHQRPTDVEVVFVEDIRKMVRNGLSSEDEPDNGDDNERSLATNVGSEDTSPPMVVTLDSPSAGSPVTSTTSGLQEDVRQRIFEHHWKLQFPDLPNPLVSKTPTPDRHQQQLGTAAAVRMKHELNRLQKRPPGNSNLGTAPALQPITTDEELLERLERVNRASLAVLFGPGHSSLNRSLTMNRSPPSAEQASVAKVSSSPMIPQIASPPIFPILSRGDEERLMRREECGVEGSNTSSHEKLRAGSTMNGFVTEGDGNSSGRRLHRRPSSPLDYDFVLVPSKDGQCKKRSRVSFFILLGKIIPSANLTPCVITNINL